MATPTTVRYRQSDGAGAASELTPVQIAEYCSIVFAATTIRSKSCDSDSAFTITPDAKRWGKIFAAPEGMVAGRVKGNPAGGNI